MAQVMETVAKTTLGQALLRVTDTILYGIEKTAQWGMPVPNVTLNDDGKGFSTVQLIRPMPWIFFIPTLVTLRIVRYFINMSGSVLGYPTIEASDMVRYVQKHRRRLRAIKITGIKNSRQLEKGSLTMEEARKALIRSIRLTLSSLVCVDSSKTSPSPPPTKIHVGSTDLDSMFPVPSTAALVQPRDPKRKFKEMDSEESSSEEDETLMDKIDRLVNEDSSDDKSFNIEDVSECSLSSCSCDTDKSEDVSVGEMQDLIEDASMLIAASDETDVLNRSLKRLSEQVKKQSILNNSTTIHVVDVQNLHDTSGLPQMEEETVDDDQLFNKSMQEFRTDEPSEVSEDPDYNSSKRLRAANRDVDLEAFYSPVSSKSSSPERSITDNDNESNRGIRNDELGNGDLHGSSANPTIVVTNMSEEPTNDVGENKRQTFTGKHHQPHYQHRGKRGNHFNRKKK